MEYIDDKYIKNTLIKRKKDAHKGDFGKVLVFAGSPGMAGAAVLCAKAALKSGAGLVRFLVPSFEDHIYQILQICVPEATCVEYRPGMRFDEYSAVAAGSGLGSSPERRAILSKIIETYKGVLILDADALNFIAGNSCAASLVKASFAEIIITPHVGEAKRLLKEGKGEDISISGGKEREAAAEMLTEKYGCTGVLKGAGTLVAQKKQNQLVLYENTTGNPGMATGGSGDVLSGVIASLAAQKYSPLDAARIGVFIHGKAGDLAAQEKGQMGLTAMDIAEYIPYALKLYY